MEADIIIPDRILTIDNFFSPAECAEHIQLSEDEGYAAATIHTKFGAVMNTDVRNNARLVYDSPMLAQDLWERVQPFMPSPLFSLPAVGLNERFRYYRYDPDQTFKPHTDGSFKRDNGEKSQVTLLIYLNDDFEGGATRFDIREPYGEFAVEPRAGMALLFLHSFRHEGVVVRSGRKYVLRTDVMYGPPTG